MNVNACQLLLDLFHFACPLTEFASQRQSVLTLGRSVGSHTTNTCNVGSLGFDACIHFPRICEIPSVLHEYIQTIYW